MRFPAVSQPFRAKWWNFWKHQGFARAAQIIQGHHRLAIASSFFVLGARSPSQKLSTGGREGERERERERTKKKKNIYIYIQSRQNEKKEGQEGGKEGRTRPGQAEKKKREKQATKARHGSPHRRQPPSRGKMKKKKRENPPAPRRERGEKGKKKKERQGGGTRSCKGKAPWRFHSTAVRKPTKNPSIKTRQHKVEVHSPRSFYHKLLRQRN